MDDQMLARIGKLPSGPALVRDALVVNGAEIVRSGGPGLPRLMLNPLDVTREMITTWREEGLDTLANPVAVFGATDYHRQTFELLAAWNAVIAGNADILERVDTGADIDRIRAAGKIGVILFVHHGEQFRTVDDVDLFYAYGLRICLPVSHAQNAIGSPVNDRSDGGLSRFGVNIVRRMNALGMAIDLSHCGERTTLDAIEASEAPIIMTHANAAALCPSPRNKSDEVIRRMAAKGGLIGAMHLRMMVTPQEPTSVADLVDHIAHIAEIVGVEHVGLGAEVPREGWDSLAKTPPLADYMRNEGVQRKLDIPELYGTTRFAVLTDAMLDHGFSEHEVRGVLGENYRRVLSQIFQGVATGTAA